MFPTFKRVVGVLTFLFAFHFGIHAQCTLNLGADKKHCYQGPIGTIPISPESYGNGLTIFQWSSSGTGTFMDSDTLFNYYKPSSVDSAMGSVTLRLTASGASCSTTFDEITYTFGHKPNVHIQNDGGSCSSTLNLTSLVQGGVSPVYEWVTNGSGTLSTPNLSSTVYAATESEMDSSKSVYFQLKVNVASGCMGMDSIFILFTNQPRVEITPSYIEVPCSNPLNNVIPLEAKIYGDNGTILWGSDGTGSFLSTNKSITSYNFSAADYSGGSNIISVTYQSIACGTFYDTLLVDYSRPPVVSGNSRTSVCAGQTVVLSNKQIQGMGYFGYNSMNGFGLFDTSGVHCTYQSSLQDTSLSEVIIYVSANNNNCQKIDTFIIQINHPPIIEAGINQTVCGVTPILLSGQVSGATSVNWTSNGSGFFNNGQTLNARYTPSASDVAQGAVLLILSGSSTGCGNASDSLIVTFGSSPQVNAGADISVCGDSVLLIGSINNGNGARWTSSGNGTFYPGSGHLVSSYRFSNADKNNGTVTFTLTASPQSGCTAASDTKIVTIGGSTAVIVNAGVDRLSNGSPITITASAVGASSYEWSTSGTGSFSTSTNLTTVYNPSLEDIANGSVDLYITASSGVCGSASDQMLIIFNAVYSISGNITVDGFPLSNGFVALFRKNPANQIIEMVRIDSLFTNETGNYAFDLLPTGSYFVLAAPTSFSNYYPTYNGNVSSWTEATPLVIGNSSLTNINISLLPLISATPNWNTGSDTLSGILVSTINTGGARIIGANDQPLSNAIIYLTNGNGNIITYTSTDKSGRFIFPKLIRGNYMIVPEIAGATLLNTATDISVDGNPSTIEGSSLVVNFPSLTTGVLNSTTAKAFQVYPNPTQEQVQFVSVWNGTTQITILNEMGMEMRVEQVNLSQGIIHEISLQGLNKGLYLIQCSNGEMIYQTKVVKQ